MTSLASSVAVVGSAGFLGRAVCEHPNAGSLVTFTRQKPLIVDGLLCPEAADCTAVIWLASSINPLIAESSPELVTRDTNELQEALSVLAARRSPPRFILVSSGGTVYGSASPPHQESDDPKPATAYGRAKLRLEELAKQGLPDAVAMRVANAYGPGQPVAKGQGVIAHWLRAIRRDEPVLLYGEPLTSRDYVYARDIAAALLLAARAETQLPPVLNLGSGSATSLADLLHNIIRIVRKERVSVEYAYSRSFDVAENWLDITLAGKVLGWAPQVALPEGIAAAWEAAQSFGDTL